MKAGKDFIGVGIGVIILQDGKVYLQKRGPDCRDFVGYWELPGGAVEVGETLHEAAKREIEEETGLQIEVKECVGVAEEFSGSHWVSFVFTAQVVGGTMSCREPRKVVEQGFFSFDKLPSPISPISGQNLKDYKSGKKHDINVVRG